MKKESCTMRQFVFVFFLFSPTTASFCGSSAAPFSFEALPDGQPVLGCARSTCFGTTGGDSVDDGRFYRINKRPDGFLRNEEDAQHPARRSKHKFKVHCEASFQSLACDPENQWVAGIAPLLNVSTALMALQCCTFEPLQYSSDRGLASVKPGQIVIGGKKNDSKVGNVFDYISNVEKIKNANNTVVYHVYLRRILCSLALTDSNPKVTAKPAHKHVTELRRAPQRGRAYQDPTVTVDDSEEVPNIFGDDIPVEAELVQGEEDATDEPPITVDPITEPPRPGPPYPRLVIRQPPPPPKEPVEPFEEEPIALPPEEPEPEEPEPEEPEHEAAEQEVTGLESPHLEAVELEARELDDPQPELSEPEAPPPAANRPRAPPPRAPAPTVFAPAAAATAPVWQAVREFFPAASGSYCFTGDTKVRMMNGEDRRIDELKVGEWIQTLQDNQVRYVPVSFWLHRVPSQEADFLRIELSNGAEVKLTPKHFIYKTTCLVDGDEVAVNELSRMAVLAEDVAEDDCLYSITDDDRILISRVTKITRVLETGIYSPMTSNGKLVVNGIYASCHSIVESSSLQRSFFTNTEKLRNMFWSFFSANSDVTELPIGMDILTSMLDLVIPRDLVTL